MIEIYFALSASNCICSTIKIGNDINHTILDKKCVKHINPATNMQKTTKGATVYQHQEV